MLKIGLKGYCTIGKLTTAEENYQLQAQLVEIGLKPKAEGEK
jgi:hypothetical protein